MAPPSPRRPGFSRRAQYRMFAAYVLAVFGVVLALALVAIARFDPVAFQRVRGAMLDVTTPVTGGGRAVLRAIGNAGSTIDDYLDAAAKNADLRRELAETRVGLIRASADRLENVRLRGLLRLREREPGTIVATRIVGSTATSTRRLATIMAGRADGVRPGQPVRGAEGLVGRVFETGEHAARLLLVTDGGSTVPVRLARDGLAALAIGTGDGRIRLRPLIAGQNPFRRGDLALSSGTGGIFPPGVPVAVVTGTDSEGALARPLADPARLDFVTVQPVYAPEALLPPPGATAAPK